MPGLVSQLHFSGDPGAGLSIVGWSGTGAQNGGKSSVDFDHSGVVPSGLRASDLSQALAQGVGQMQGLALQHHSWVGRPPERRLVCREPRKDALSRLAGWLRIKSNGGCQSGRSRVRADSV